MIKIKPKYHPVYIGVMILINILMITGVLWLAAIANKPLYWVVTVIITLILIYMITKYFVELYEPKYISPKPENRFEKLEAKEESDTDE